eukprot:scaffold26420_cov110-Isochrysis_galbana.AAC.1
MGDAIEVYWDGPKRYYTGMVMEIVEDVGRRWAVLVKYSDNSEIYHSIDGGEDSVRWPRWLVAISGVTTAAAWKAACRGAEAVVAERQMLRAAMAMLAMARAVPAVAVPLGLGSDTPPPLPAGGC